jgi:hypothetical protein
MQTTFSSIDTHANAILNAQADIIALQEKIKVLKENVINDLTQEFTADLQIVKDAILQAFPKARIKPKTLGFTVQCPDFKHSSPTEIKKATNENLKSSGITIKAHGTEVYASDGYDWKYKTVDVNLTKEWMKKARPQHKEVILMIEC